MDLEERHLRPWQMRSSIGIWIITDEGGGFRHSAVSFHTRRGKSPVTATAASFDSDRERR
jgi:hypothetical protein